MSILEFLQLTIVFGCYIPTAIRNFYNFRRGIAKIGQEILDFREIYFRYRNKYDGKSFLVRGKFDLWKCHIKNKNSCSQVSQLEALFALQSFHYPLKCKKMLGRCYFSEGLFTDVAYV